MRISVGSSDVCSSDLWLISSGCALQDRNGEFQCLDRHRARGRVQRRTDPAAGKRAAEFEREHRSAAVGRTDGDRAAAPADPALHGIPAPVPDPAVVRSEEHTSELQSILRIPYAVFRLKKKN